MVVDVLRRIFSRGQAWDATGSYADPTAGVGIDYSEGVNYDEIMANLEVRRTELEHVKNIVIDEIKEAYNTIVEAVRKGDRETAELLAAEIAVKKNIAKALTMVTKLLSVAISRIKTARTAEEAARVLGPILAVLRGLSPYLSSVSPDIAIQVVAIKDEIERLYATPAPQLPSMDTKSVLDMMPEAKAVLREAVREATEELERELPDEANITPAEIDMEALESKVIEYIKRNNGRINIKVASAELGISPALIRKVLLRLEERGVIKLAPRRSQAYSI
jgi:uncharacterized membrane protein